MSNRRCISIFFNCCQHEAVNHGHVAIAELLLDHGAFVNIPGLDNDTPLHDAVQSGRLKCAQLLVRRGANKHARFAIPFS